MERPADVEGGRTAVPTSSLEAFLNALASAKPAPGGGAAAAVAAGLAAALVGMVGRISMERDAAAAGLATVVDAADGFRRLAVLLIGDDADAYRAVLRTRRTGGEEFQRALARATDVPLEVVRITRETLALGEAAAPRARASVLGDLRAAVALAWGAIEGAAVTVKANLLELTDPVLAARFRKELDDSMVEAEALRRRARTLIEQRTGVPGSF